MVSTRLCRFLPFVFLPASPGSGYAGPRTGSSMRVNLHTPLELSPVPPEHGISHTKYDEYDPACHHKPQVKIMTECAAGWKMHWGIAPLATRTEYIHQAVNNITHLHFAGRPPRLAGGIKGSTSRHSSSARSPGYRNLLRSY
jgi:hypothetical protein